MLDRAPGTAKDHIGYHDLTQAALRAVVRGALAKAVKLGHLPADHHFYITFRTRLQGVQMSDDLKDKFPDEMTIVIQHQYWDFQVFEDRFEVTLKFGGVSHPLRIPFAAISRFVDPSTGFGVQLDTDSKAAGGETVLPLVAAGSEIAAHQPAEEPPKGAVVSLDAFRRK